MGYERYPRGTNPQGDYYNRGETQDYGRDYGSGREGSYSSARDFEAAGEMGGNRGSGGRGYGQRDYGQRDYGQRDYGQRDYGQRDYGNQRYAQRDEQGSGRSNYGGGDYGRGMGGGQYGRGYEGRDQGGRYGQQTEYHGSYASDGRRFEDVGRYSHADDDNYRQGRGGERGRSYGGQPQGYDYQDRGFFQRAGDEVRSWFGDDDAERRRNEDARRDEQYYSQNDRYGSDRHRDSDYHNWRSGQMAALDRDYDEYRQENRSRFENEFSSWRTNRQGQRDQLGKVNEHMEVVGSDDEHVGTVDKVRGDRVLLTKNDSDAGGRHHSFPSSWIKSVDDKVKLTKSAAEAKQQWQDEERNQAMFQYGDNTDQNRGSQNRNDQNRNDQNRSDQSASSSAAGSASSTSSAKTY